MSDGAIYLPNKFEVMAARGAIVSLVDSVAHGNLEPHSEVLDEIILSVVRSLGWRPASGDPQGDEALGMKFRVVWEEWTGTVWMRRHTDARDEVGALNFYHGNLWGHDVRNLCIEEVGE